ncbi:MAG: bifunctional [glutamate--ammonia ligase]-adenylyl-L-tyrosine phosphorylase/[glutamate--ammonia-ligase] adenylyltransferase [Thiotrichales bacterium]|jgi:glutamate-ammonia-ligase adenylyltransferase|nr:bifunctional [glutamate--ammonia ligase]-adenylyl-L-tyrosine phosphorylase/[glutamate--ammonia-ligase] adenylyltransferase [Thiotrichales bacterium]MBT3614097.1 bifunctional [glutamate--ammonia ligase]-adenylyl-L-tyrosine phosphorylase/[glutamate--ammonia-ligase] adenylyltransferase [Thiotrichales bacterium]MBT3752781.1 bifunctional [glutamate--ammonia ligase]-adenylyl-L-tyrosine phosphorylase/[glutamate--ammonia-ligase] adenylyltransferase [Thiotrichales bacterium]MBT4152233.1 bifunctional [
MRNDTTTIEEISDKIKELLKFSPYVEQSFRQDPELLQRLLKEGRLYSESPELSDKTDYQNRLQQRLHQVVNNTQLSKELRHFRREEMVRIALRDLAGWADYHTTVRDLSALADTVVSQTLNILYKWHCRDLGTPKGELSGKPQQLVVVAMGKLGAGELNFSSDIDLIFTYPEDGETRGKRPWISNQEFFLKLAQQLIRAINNRLADGIVFRVDMRLRPFGESGLLVSSFAAMEDYYQLHGRSWERYAWIKGRVISGDSKDGDELIKMMRPFIYRRYIDYSAFESLREMKQMIADQVSRKGMEQNIKLGSGGIREIEFIGQAFQLVRGGAEAELQMRPILKVLPLLAKRGEISVADEQLLQKAYLFLRNTEHRLQEYDDRQTQELPTDEERQALLAESMGFDSWLEFYAQLQLHRKDVEQQFAQLFTLQGVDADNNVESAATKLWQETITEIDIGPAQLSWIELNFNSLDKVTLMLQQLRESSPIQSMSREGHERLNNLIPLLLEAAVEQGRGSNNESEQILEQALGLVEAIGRRSVYFSLLAENRATLNHLLKLQHNSSWIAEKLAQRPMLIDGLLDPRTLLLPEQQDALTTELELFGERVAQDDLEQQMEIMRHFQSRHLIKVAAVDVMDRLPIMEVSDALSWLAESVLNYSFKLSWREMIKRLGKPRKRSENIVEPGFVVLGYGKLGGLELGYGSDLDLVFLHTGSNNEPFSRKKSPVTRREFYARLVQRMIHLITTRTMSGRLYEIDSRLRPNGNSGMLVMDMSGFRSYQLEEAWTWEHQALVRARVVAGGKNAAAEFAAIRAEILSLKRDPQKLLDEVVAMREKMRGTLDNSKADKINLKQMKGGMVDIEFMVQYLVLRWAAETPELLQWSDNIRLLEQLAQADIIKSTEAELLINYYQSYRRRAYHLTLQNSAAVVSSDEFINERSKVLEIWDRVMRI